MTLFTQSSKEGKRNVCYLKSGCGAPGWLNLGKGPTLFFFLMFGLFLKKKCLFLKERERERNRAQAREGQRERERETETQNRK